MEPIEINDRLPVWLLVKTLDMPQRRVIPLLNDLELPIDADPGTGAFYTSRSAVRELFGV